MILSLLVIQILNCLSICVIDFFYAIGLFLHLFIRILSSFSWDITCTRLSSPVISLALYKLLRWIFFVSFLRGKRSQMCLLFIDSWFCFFSIDLIWVSTRTDCLNCWKLLLSLIWLNSVAYLIIFQVLFIQILVCWTLWEIVILNRLQGLIICFCRWIVIAGAKIISQGVKIRIIWWINNLTKISLPSNFLSIRILITTFHHLLILSVSIFR